MHQHWMCVLLYLDKNVHHIKSFVVSLMLFHFIELYWFVLICA